MDGTRRPGCFSLISLAILAKMKLSLLPVGSPVLLPGRLFRPAKIYWKGRVSFISPGLDSLCHPGFHYWEQILRTHGTSLTWEEIQSHWIPGIQGVSWGVWQANNQWCVLVDKACTDRDCCLEKLWPLIFPHHNPKIGSNAKPVFPSFSKVRLDRTPMSWGWSK